jgi:hypothetical protein
VAQAVECLSHKHKAWPKLQKKKRNRKLRLREIFIRSQNDSNTTSDYVGLTELLCIR